MNLKNKAFSLIEVVIALGIFAFCIVGIFGLLPIAANSAKSVSQETNANNIAESIAGMWQVASNNSTITSAYNFPITNLEIRTTPLETNYFNEFGQATNSNSAALRMEYEVTSNNYFSVNMTFYWPANAPTNSPNLNKRTFNYIFYK